MTKTYEQKGLKSSRYIGMLTLSPDIGIIVSQNRGFTNEFHLDSNCRIVQVISRAADDSGNVHGYDRAACLKRKKVGCSRYLPFFAK